MENDTDPLTAADAEARDAAFRARGRKKTAQEKMEAFLRETILADAPQAHNDELNRVILARAL